MKLDKLVEEVTDGASEVYSTLGAGYIEAIYEEAMAVEFRRRKLPYEVQRNTEVFYKGEKVGTHRLDFIVDDQLVVELKAGTRLSPSHRWQTQSYLKTLELTKCVLVNFPYPQAEQPEIDVVEQV